MKRALAVGALALLPLTTGCVMEIHEYGASIRGAAVVADPYGDPNYRYTGGAETSYDTCVWVLSQRIDVGTSQQACQVWYRWQWGSLGFIQL